MVISAECGKTVRCKGQAPRRPRPSGPLHRHPPESPGAIAGAQWGDWGRLQPALPEIWSDRRPHRRRSPPDFLGKFALRKWPGAGGGS